MADYGAQDTSTTTLGANQFPISEAWTPNAGFSAVEGGTQTTDAGGKKSAPVRVEVKDGSDLTQGAQADAAWTLTGNATEIAILKKLALLLNGTLTISGSVVTAGTVTEANSAASKTDLDTIVTNTNKIPTSPATEGGHLATIDSHIPALGQALAAASVPVVLTSAQQTALTPPAAITGFALEAGHLSTIDTSTASSKTDLDAISTVSGVTTDVAVVGDNTGTISAKLRGLTKIFSDVWDSVNHRIHVNVDNGNANGQSTMANSSPVVIASDQSAVQVKGGVTEVTGGAGVTALNTDLIPSTDVSAYKCLSLHITGTFSATLSFQCSNDNINWLAVPLTLSIGFTTQNSASATTNTNGLWTGPIFSKYFRVRATSFASNTSLAGTLELYNHALSLPITSNVLVPSSIGTSNDFHLISAATTNANNVKSSAGQVYGYDFGNNGASDAYVKLYNKSTSPTVGTDTPFRTIYVPKGGKAVYHTTVGIKMNIGIGVGITGVAADSDTTAVAASQVTVEIDYV